MDLDGHLRIRNRIYEAVFDDKWVRKNRPRPKTVLTAVAASVAVLAIGIGAWYTLLLPREYIRVLQTAAEDVNLAVDAAVKLKRIPGFSKEANRLLADYWDRRAVRAAFSEDRDRSLVMRINSVAF